MLSRQNNSDRDRLINSNIQHYYANFKTTENLTLDSEYQFMAGKAYEDGKKEYGKIVTNRKHLSQTDIKLAKSLYIHGHNKQQIVTTIMQRSPATKGMKKVGRELYKKNLLRQMNKVEIKQEKIQSFKQTYGIESNNKRNIRNYQKCVFAEHKARKQGVMISHLNYRQFQKEKSPNFHKKYVAKIERDIKRQQQIDLERQRKVEQQKQHQIQRQRSL